MVLEHICKFFLIIFATGCNFCDSSASYAQNNKNITAMKKIILLFIAAFFINMCQVLEASAQEVYGILQEARTQLNDRKAELLSGRQSFQDRIDHINDTSVDNQLDNGRIAALESGIRDIDATLAKIDIALDAISNSGIVNSYYSSRVELSRNGNTVRIYKHVADNSITVEVNGTKVINEDGFDSVNILEPRMHLKNKKDFSGHLSGIFLGINGLLLKNGEYEAPVTMPYFELNESRSLDFSVYFNDFAVPFSKNCGLVMGTALQFNHYSFQQVFDLTVNDHMVTADYDHTVATEFKRFNYRIIHFNFPIVFEIATSGRQKFFVNAGVMGGVRIGSRTKQIYVVDGDRQKNCSRKTFDTNLFKYSFIGGVGYRCFQVFGEYSPVPLFKSGHASEDLYPFSLGVKFLF